jgi:hypothetical protein
MEYVEKRIDLEQHPKGEVTILPIGDVQSGVPASDLTRLRRHMNWGASNRALFLGMGDYVDMASPSNRRSLKAATLYDSVTSALEAKAQEDVGGFLEAVGGSEHMWLGLLQGHHFMELEDGNTSDTMIAQALGAPFLGDSAMVRLIFNDTSDCDGNPVSATIWCHHGRGSGNKAGSPLNTIEQVARGFNADIYLMGHQHKKVAAPTDELFFSSRGQLLHHTKLLACTGSFLKGYLENSMLGGRASGTYVEKGMMAPVSLGGIVIRLRVIQESYGDRLDMSVEL